MNSSVLDAEPSSQAKTKTKSPTPSSPTPNHTAIASTETLSSHTSKAFILTTATLNNGAPAARHIYRSVFVGARRRDASRVDSRAEAAERGFQLEERPLRGQCLGMAAS
jgi:hypothetical protein